MMKKRCIKNLLKDSKAYYGDNDYYEIFSKAEDGERKVSSYLRELSQDKIVLDAGCGTGKFLEDIESVCREYIGVDLSEQQLVLARKKSHKDSSKFLCSNLSELSLEDHLVDLIVCSWVLGTIIDLEERKKCLSELKRVLKKGGRIFLVENDEGGEFERIRGRNLDTRTRDYNQWILDHGFVVDKKIQTYFNFQSFEECFHCFRIIYGERVLSKINNFLIEHHIILFSLYLC